jgi:hypothetical protein
MADVYLCNRLSVALKRASYDKRSLALPPEEIQPNTTLAWQVEDAGSVTYDLPSRDDSERGVVKRFTLEWSLSPGGEVRCRAHDVAKTLRIDVEGRPEGVLCTVGARRRRVPPPPRRGRLLARIVPVAAGIVVATLLGATLTVLGAPHPPHPPTPGPSVTVFKQAPANLAVSPDHAGSVTCSTHSVAYPAITLRNVGGQPLHWKASASGPKASVAPASGTLDPAQAQRLAVSQPGPPGKAATVTITSDGGSATLAFYCIGSPPQLAVSPTQMTTVTCTGSSVSYPSIRVSNVGGQTLSWHAGVTASAASVNPSSGSLGAGQSQTLGVTQSGPTTTATNVTITSTAGSAVVRFTCAPPTPHGNLAVNPTSLALGNYCGQGFSGVGVTLKNSGTGSLTWSLQGGSGFTLSPSNGQLNAGASRSVAVSGTKSNASFKIGWLDGGQGSTHTVTVSVSCVTQPPPNASLRVTQNQNFSDVCTAVPPEGYLYPDSYTVTLDNTGSNVAVTWQFQPSGTDAYGNVWASASPSSGTVSAGQVATFSVNPDQGVCYGANSYNGTATLALSFPQGGWQPNIALTDTISH